MLNLKKLVCRNVKGYAGTENEYSDTVKAHFTGPLSRKAERATTHEKVRALAFAVKLHDPALAEEIFNVKL